MRGTSKGKERRFRPGLWGLDLNAASRNGPHDPPAVSKLSVLITESNEAHMQTQRQIKTETD